MQQVIAFSLHEVFQIKSYVAVAPNRVRNVLELESTLKVLNWVLKHF